MPDSIDSLRSALAAQYDIEREIGEGASATVYLAHDRKHGRRVAIKVLKATVATGTGEQRFLQEIGMLARMQHPNILPLYDSGKADSLLYYVTPYVTGETLRARLQRERRLSIDAACEIARETADALAFAHSEHVIHRDIKPENILLSNGHAMVADFGIARAIHLANLEHLTITGAGTPGTPLYMSPEQLFGDSSPDARTDIYSLGCVLYEMLDGNPPFTGHDGILRRFHEDPPRISERREGTPRWIDDVIMRAMARDPDRRFQNATEMGAALRAGSATSIHAESLSLRGLLRAARRPRIAVGILAAVAVVGGLAWAGIRATSAPSTPTIAVLPFANVGGDSGQQYLAEGMADGVATALGRYPGMRIVSRTVTLNYRGPLNGDARAIRQLLGADYVVQAQLRRVGDKLRVSAQLVSAADNSEAWSEDFDREAADASMVQDSIADAVASKLIAGARGPVNAGNPSATGHTADPEAYDLYLRGRYLLARRGPGVSTAVERFEQAIQRDRNFARAYAGLSMALELLPYFSATNPNVVRDRAVEAAKRALLLDPTLAEAHTALAMAFSHAYEWQAALAEHQRAVALAPNDAEVLLQYGRFLHCTGHVADARTQFQRARAADPFYAVAAGWLGHLLSLNNQHDAALAELDRALEINSDSAPPVLFMATQANMIAGNRRKAGELVNRLWDRVPAWRGAAAMLLVQLGDSARARATAGVIEATPRQWLAGTSTVAMIYSALGDTAKALTLLERATDTGEMWPMAYSLSEREVDPLRRNARFARIVRRVGLDDRIFTSPTGGRPQ
jgi:serine/threonine-protein kinase